MVYIRKMSASRMALSRTILWMVCRASRAGKPCRRAAARRQSGKATREAGNTHEQGTVAGSNIPLSACCYAWSFSTYGVWPSWQRLPSRQWTWSHEDQAPCVIAPGGVAAALPWSPSPVRSLAGSQTRSHPFGCRRHSWLPRLPAQLASVTRHQAFTSAWRLRGAHSSSNCRLVSHRARRLGNLVSSAPMLVKLPWPRWQNASTSALGCVTPGGAQVHAGACA